MQLLLLIGHSRSLRSHAPHTLAHENRREEGLEGGTFGFGCRSSYLREHVGFENGSVDLTKENREGSKILEFDAQSSCCEKAACGAGWAPQLTMHLVSTISIPLSQSCLKDPDVMLRGNSKVLIAKQGHISQQSTKPRDRMPVWEIWLYVPWLLRPGRAIYEEVHGKSSIQKLSLQYMPRIKHAA